MRRPYRQLLATGAASWRTVTAVALVALSCCAPAHAATTLNATAAAPDGVLGDGQCSLREAIDVAEGKVRPDCGASSGAPFTIELGAGTHHITLAGAGEDANVSGDLDITAPMTLVGTGSDATVVSKDDHSDRVFHVLGGVAATFSSITVTGGRSPDGSAAATSYGGDAEDGGGILSAGTLTLDHVRVANNSAGTGGLGGTHANGNPLPGGAGGDGGGIADTGSITVLDSTISSNSAGTGGMSGIAGPGAAVSGAGGRGGAGGAIACSPQCVSVTVVRSAVTGNTAGNGGNGADAGTSTPGTRGGNGGIGGALAVGGTVVIASTTISGNTAGRGGSAGSGGQTITGAGGGAGGYGGAISQTGGSLQVTDSTISDNRSGSGGAAAATGGGGGPGGDGGGIYAETAHLTMLRTTVARNVAGDGHAATAGSSQAGAEGGHGGSGGGLVVAEYVPLDPQPALSLEANAIYANAGGRGGDSPTAAGAGGDGGGILIESPQPVSIVNSTIAENNGGHGGNGTSGGTLGAGGRGGAIAAFGHGSLALNQDTIAANATGLSGDGSAASGPAIVDGGISAHTAVTLQNSIVAFNTPQNCNLGAVADGGYNVAYPDSTCPGLVADPRLAALGAYGGPTQTMALAEGSSAIDLVPAGCPATDQRGVARPQGSACDAGAFEREASDGETAAAQTSNSGPEPSQSQDPAIRAPDTRSPRVVLRLFRQRVRSALMHGYVVRLRTSTPGAVSARLFALGRGRRVSGAVAVGRHTVRGAGVVRFRLTFTTLSRKRFAELDRLRLRLVVVFRDARGRTATAVGRAVLN